MGTWAMPDTKKKKEEAIVAIALLKEIKDKMYHVLGDDTFFDGIDNAIRRGEQLIQVTRENTK